MNHHSQEPDLEKLSFEEAFQELDVVVQQLEQGDLPLEEAIGLYERGMALAGRCSQALDAAELRVQQVAVAGGQQQLGFFLDEDEPPG
jgi:exodeoxyribonuclease VII small subunit